MRIESQITKLNEGLERKPVVKSEDERLRQACKDFESVFVAQMLKGMRSTVQSSDLFGSQKEEAMFRDMLDDEIARAASEQKGMGIADMLYKQLSRAQKPLPNTEKPLKVDVPIVEK